MSEANPSLRLVGRTEDETETMALVLRQRRETVRQEADGVTVRMGTITCPCGRERALVLMYKCLFCDVWFCQQCAEAHFGKTRAEWLAEQQQASNDEAQPTGGNEGTRDDELHEGNTA